MIEPTQHIIDEASRLTYEELQSVSEAILEMLDDKKWDALFASPKSIAYAEKRYRELKNAEGIKYLPGKSIADHFR